MEKKNYREMLGSLTERFPALIRAADAADLLGVSARTVQRMVAKGQLAAVNGKITIGSLARLLC